MLQMKIHTCNIDSDYLYIVNESYCEFKWANGFVNYADKKIKIQYKSKYRGYRIWYYCDLKDIAKNAKLCTIVWSYW